MKYFNMEIGEAMGMVSLYDNLSMKEGKPFPYVHAALSGDKGNGKGGQSLPGGTPLFAYELALWPEPNTL